MCYKCLNCGATFYEPDKKYTSYEAYYGVDSEFPNSTPLTLFCCPCCGDDEIEEYDEEEGD